MNLGKPRNFAEYKLRVQATIQMTQHLKYPAAKIAEYLDIEQGNGTPGGAFIPDEAVYKYNLAMQGYDLVGRRCQYCAQVSQNDSRGGCVACGGPRC